jgi:2-dehydropantoate 2-reductase
MKFAIYGAGAMGTVLGAWLTKEGVDIDLINRNKEHVVGLKTNGASIVGTVTFTQPVKAYLPEEMKGPYDVIFLMTKQLNNVEIVKSLVPNLATDGVICTMQNGLPEHSVASVIGKDRTYGCAVSWGATMKGSGVAELTTQPSRETLTFSLGSYSGKQDERFEAIKDVLNLMGNVETNPNFLGARWSKLLVNSAFSGLSTITGATFGEIATKWSSRVIALDIIKECIDVAKAVGIKVEPIQGKDIAKMLDYHNPIKRLIGLLIIPIAMKKHRLLKSSMLQDLLNGKHCEIEAINGVVAAYGDDVNVDTPLNDRIIQIVKDIEAGLAKPCWENLAKLKELKR